MAYELLSELEALKVRNDILEGELADLKAQLKHNNQQLAEAQTASKGLQSQLMQREKMASLGELDRAIEVSLAVRDRIGAIEEFTDRPAFLPQVSIGINTGEVISGNIGSVTLRRLDFTVIGDVVNTAQRLQSVAKAGQIVISQKAYDEVKESFKCREVGEFTLKNKAKPVTVYEVLE